MVLWVLLVLLNPSILKGAYSGFALQKLISNHLNIGLFRQPRAIFVSRKEEKQIALGGIQFSYLIFTVNILSAYDHGSVLKMSFALSK